MPVTAPTPFRPDIAGLRAWAVLAVVLFHFGVPGFGGGFVGVDSFFVISGFLKTQIIVCGLEGGKVFRSGTFTLPGSSAPASNILRLIASLAKP